MDKTTEIAAIEQELDGILAILLRESQGSRCTLRMDDPARGWNVDFICAEAIRPSVKWLAMEKRNLVQPDLTGSPIPPPPPALMSAYAAKAQMLAPLLMKNGHLVGWISVHYVDGTHAFTADEERALDRAAAKIDRLIGIGV
jgi:hypothetical protein